MGGPGLGLHTETKIRGHTGCPDLPCTTDTDTKKTQVTEPIVPFNGTANAISDTFAPMFDCEICDRPKLILVPLTPDILVFDFRMYLFGKLRFRCRPLLFKLLTAFIYYNLPPVLECSIKPKN